MRALLTVASFALLVGAGISCGDDTTSAASDMTAVHDMAVTMPTDMTTLTCAQINSCVKACGSNQSCDATCVDEGNSNAKQLIQAFQACVFETCQPTDGGGNGSCSSMTDTSTGCVDCLNTTSQNAALGSGPCAISFATCASS